MKKVIMILFLSVALIFSCVDISEAIDWKITNQITIAWDATKTLNNGSAIPTDNSVKYRVYLSNAITDPGKTNPVLLGETDLLLYTITLVAEGRYFAAVQAVRYDSAGNELMDCADESGNLISCKSTLNWSDINGDNTPNPFGLTHFMRIGSPKNLR